MKITKVWIEFEDDHGDIYLRPATSDDLEYLGLKPGSLQKPAVPAVYPVVEETIGPSCKGADFEPWEPNPYTAEEIAALRLTPGDLREAAK